ncbi:MULTISPECIES: bifunctional 3-(3-hydroxy-phenyl)propionate/3-hydroxycinnamic acid hydroxylase MhpA [Rhodococcus]|uniref:3-(3-hydroxyphenyl)propionate hydroxylase n=1 Tax=Rhodococcus opacus RKJ300 = JCM 13270 TaxID=1165867 RepID=I0W964_RHOOP|nr:MULTISPECIES: bifunctional 3-(3-hydroxy-phenyl)propionate/3-hydroxycinnamic acid hydroxylase [Rhodococcus]EID72930.1 3-(3-hydroxyphenyl)propionate hydroxylase [Rhodococcus opacus RKJ300 = JCM 13270]QQZ14229.1 bifunctional 3-(3-hydroxy-phenyl)propionate/3-hydroxycinnamic acid hydroxylase [Rhodococcus sp. 21391]
MSSDFDVAVVGYGPTGLVLASLLGRAGHRVVVLERWPDLYGLPRLTHIDGETARIIQAAGDIEFALRDASPKDTYQWCNGSGDVLLEIDWAGKSSGFAAHYSMYQPDIESAIHQRIGSYPNVEVNQGFAVVAVEQEHDHVALHVRPWSRDRDEQWSSGTDRVVTARYVVGADGANSFVRTALGIEATDLGVNDRWLNIDTECVRPLGPDFGVARQFCDPAHPNMFMPIGVSRQRFEVAVLPGDDAAFMESEEYAWQWFRERHDLGPEDVRILRQIIYTFSARNAETWRSGRVLLAGDAAHTMPPYMGQGACSGMRDGITLAWKLHLVLSGRASDELLDTYELERRPHAQAIQQCAIALGEIANLEDPAAAATRDAAFLRGEVPPRPPFPTLGAGVIATNADRLPARLAGSLSPQGVVTVGDRVGRFDDLLGWGFSIVAVQDPRSVLDPGQLSFLDDLDVIVATTEPGRPGSFTDSDGTYADFFRDHGIEVYLARPDFHLFGAGSMSELPLLVDALRAALSYQDAQAPRVERAAL